MPENYILITVNSKYCNYLRRYDYRVSYNNDKKEKRPYVGVLFIIESHKYFAPLSSPKQKHLKMKNTLDFYKLDDGNLGAINFNNMIPIPESEYQNADIISKNKNEKDRKYKKLLSEQIHWLNRKGKSLRNKAKTLYIKRVNNELPKNMEKRCCDFKLLEQKCEEYKKNSN